MQEQESAICMVALFLDEYTDLFGENYKKIFIENNGKIFLLAEVESWTALNMKRHV